MKMLILEDDGFRVNLFIEMFYSHELTITENAYDAIELLSTKKFDYIFLDHDLGENNGSGSLVSSFLKNHPKNLNNKSMIIIHSWNNPAAQAMLSDLPNALWVPFNTDPFYAVVSTKVK